MKKLSLMLATLLLLGSLVAAIDLNNPFGYATQSIPNYITKDNTPANNLADNKKATLGRILFYDTKLSANQTIACASCHKQAFAFGDTALQSVGLNGGLTGRHSMRLINARFADEQRFFWDERATSLENQSTMPIQDHIEMGFSGTNGDPDLNALIQRLDTVSYYPGLFTWAFGDPTITENRMQQALAQFVRSIQSFDSKYDAGLAQTGNPGAPFPNFTQQENQGKAIFTAPPPNGAGCQGCHRAPEFDIGPNSGNNNVVGVAGSPGATDFTNTRAPSLRDLVNPNGVQNGPFMHDGSLNTLAEVIDHYNLIQPIPGNPNLDNRLAGPGGQGQNLQLTNNEKAALEAFLRTLSGTAVYTAEQWSDPFDAQGNISIIGLPNTGFSSADAFDFELFPNPSRDWVKLSLPGGQYRLELLSLSGQQLRAMEFEGQMLLHIEGLASGIYIVRVVDQTQGKSYSRRLIKQ